METRYTHNSYGTRQRTACKTYSDCRAVLADAALHENCVEVAVAGKCTTDKTKD